ncbi:type III secretion protein HrpV [Pseudomonas sp. LRF_L74]|uniref:type III secretion protein HrpV n=1 Tax=Pseudomonas sp. LRF_L74 TaxID=3369422 RepID=UPI003F60BCE0
MVQVSQKHAFLELAAAECHAVWPLAAGVAFVSRQEHQNWGVALHVENAMLEPQQLRDTLARRFSQADRFHDYFLMLNPQRDFVVWHAAPGPWDQALSLDEICHEELALAGLDHLVGH